MDLSLLVAASSDLVALDGSIVMVRETTDSDLFGFGLGGRLDSTPPTGRGRLEFVFVASTVPCFLLSS